MFEDRVIVATSVLEGIRENRHPVERTLRVNALSKSDDR